MHLCWKFQPAILVHRESFSNQILFMNLNYIHDCKLPMDLGYYHDTPATNEPFPAISPFRDAFVVLDPNLIRHVWHPFIPPFNMWIIHELFSALFPPPKDQNNPANVTSIRPGNVFHRDPKRPCETLTSWGSAASHKIPRPGSRPTAFEKQISVGNLQQSPF